MKGQCPNGPHRPPEGPNEDISQCPTCWALTFEMRPDNETYGQHLPDCSLPLRHERACVGGGLGHPKAQIIRGYFPQGLGWHDSDCQGGRHADDGTCPTSSRK